MTRTSLFLSTLLLLACGGTQSTGSTTPPTGGDATPPPAAHLAIGTRTQGELTASDRVDEEGRHVDDYDLDLDEGQLVRIHVPGAGDVPDPWLGVTGPNGFAIENDDALPNTLDSMVQFRAPITGTYRVSVHGAVGDVLGAYRIDVGALTDVPGDALALGERATGTLGAVSDPAFPGHSFLRFEGQGGAIVRIRVTSRDFDTIATVIGPHGEAWINDDANDLGPEGTERALDSTVFVALPESGTYQLIVSSYGQGSTGSFAVATTVRPPVIVHQGETVVSGPFAGPEGRGRILGMYVGITEYTTHSRLYGCADDATFLGEAMRAAHLQRVDEQIVLTDSQATQQAFLAGIRSLAERAQPEDVVMIFYSGHGNVIPVPAGGDPHELDGIDETVVMVDGQLTDTEVSHELDAIRAGTTILALDSCHAGGFAEDFMTRPGRMGIFSSDEDVLSDTAEPRRAGGYVSWYLRRGVLGEADYKPHDGVLYAGELTDYLYEGFVTDDDFMNPPGHLDPAQHLVIRRGSIGWNTILWAYPRGEDLAIPALPDLPLTSSAP
ncbi:MAG: caspase family protein [Sandaracinus sp.]